MRPLWRVEGRHTHRAPEHTDIYSHFSSGIRYQNWCYLPALPGLSCSHRKCQGCGAEGLCSLKWGASVSRAGLECKVIKEVVRVISVVHVTCLLLTVQLYKYQTRQISRLEKYTKVASVKVFSRTQFSKPSRKTGSAGSFPFLRDYSFHRSHSKHERLLYSMCGSARETSGQPNGDSGKKVIIVITS